MAAICVSNLWLVSCELVWWGKRRKCGPEDIDPQAGYQCTQASSKTNDFFESVHVDIDT